MLPLNLVSVRCYNCTWITSSNDDDVNDNTKINDDIHNAITRTDVQIYGNYVQTAYL